MGLSALDDQLDLMPLRNGLHAQGSANEIALCLIVVEVWY